MLPSLVPRSPLFLSLNTLNKPCSELHTLLCDRSADPKEVARLEHNLWKLIKDTRELKNEDLLRHLIGFYQTLLFHVDLEQQGQEDLLLYQLLIRLGDLNRYVEQAVNAEYYYSNARNLFPSYGHAYNQLALLTDPKNLLKCCYYYARAAKSSDRPLTGSAGSNLRFAVAKSGPRGKILDHVLNDDSVIDPKDASEDLSVPDTALKWFFTLVVAIYNDNIQPIAKLFLDYLSENFSTQKASTVSSENIKTTTIYCDKDSYLLLTSLDILLDWLNLGSQSKTLLPRLISELRQIRSCLHATLMSLRCEPASFVDDHRNKVATDSTSPLRTLVKYNETTVPSPGLTSESSSNLQDASISVNLSLPSSKDSSVNSQKMDALPHDYVLRGFKPLERVHKQLNFDRHELSLLKSSRVRSFDGCGSNSRFTESDELKEFLSRIKMKMDGFGPLVRRQTRNIALESILSNMTGASEN